MPRKERVAEPVRGGVAHRPVDAERLHVDRKVDRAVAGHEHQPSRLVVYAELRVARPGAGEQAGLQRGDAQLKDHHGLAARRAQIGGYGDVEYVLLEIAAHALPRVEQLEERLGRGGGRAGGDGGIDVVYIHRLDGHDRAGRGDAVQRAIVYVGRAVERGEIVAQRLRGLPELIAGRIVVQRQLGGLVLAGAAVQTHAVCPLPEATQLHEKGARERIGHFIIIGLVGLAQLRMRPRDHEAHDQQAGNDEKDQTGGDHAR